MHPLLKELAHRGLELKKTHEGYELDGFYKSGTVRFSLNKYNSEILDCHQRYEEVDSIKSFDELVMINFKWWDRSRGRSEFWQKPEDFWLKEFERMNLIEISTKIIYTPRH